MREHVNDPFVQLAKKEGWRSRAAFKLMEMDDKDRLLRRGEVVVDLGATPGGWSQVAARRVGESGMVLALDLLEMEPIHGVDFIQGDFREEDVYKRQKLLDADGRCVFGATVEIEDQDSGDVATYQIVGEDEADIKNAKLSVASPMARALIGKYAGDIAQVQACLLYTSRCV